jgi:hypothetical protein
LLEADTKYRLNSEGEFDGRPDYLRIDTTSLSPADAHRSLRPGGLSPPGLSPPA